MAHIICHDLEDIIFGVLSESIAKCRDCVFRLTAKNQEWEIMKGKIKSDRVEKDFCDLESLLVIVGCPN